MLFPKTLDRFTKFKIGQQNADKPVVFHFELNRLTGLLPRPDTGVVATDIATGVQIEYRGIAMNTKQRGFTLVEIAIVLVIIGLLLGGVLKGQAMIDNARYKRLVADLDSFRSEVFMFQDRYGALPGDMINAKTRLNPGATNGNGDGVIRNGYCNNSGEESCLVWSHLRYAGLLSGDPSLIDSKARITDNPYGGVYDAIATGNWGNKRSELKILMRNIPGDVAQRLDDDIDDGNSTTGDVSDLNGKATYDPNGKINLVVSL